MNNLRDLKKRIINVGVIEKMAQSMKAISTSRLSVAKSFRRASHDYLSVSKYVLETLIELERKEASSNIEFIKNMFTVKEDSEYKKTLYIIISSDRGLCGSYNSNVFRVFLQNINNKDNEKYFILPIGGKALQFINKLDKNSVLDLFISSDTNQNLSENITKITSYISNLVIASEVDRIQFVYTKSQSIMLQEVLTETIFPINTMEVTNSGDAKRNTNQNIVTDVNNFADLIQELLKQYIAINIFDKMTKSAISEHASRLNAMSNAYDNSKELKRSLYLEYNRTRQGIITRELIEIISGAEAF